MERLGPALLLCDYNMPILDGLQTLELLRQKWSAVELPILMLTGITCEESESRGARFGICCRSSCLAATTRPERRTAEVHTS